MIDFEQWWRQPELNRRPSTCEADALPTELYPHFDSERRSI